jgi:hypothetical protein
MDLRIQNLRKSYLSSGDYETGLALLRAYLHAGFIPYRHVELAAAYRYPLAIDLVGSQSETAILPQKRGESTDWPCEVYIKRCLAVSELAYEEIRNALGIDDELDATIIAAHRFARNCISGSPSWSPQLIDFDQTHHLFQAVIEYTQEFLNYSGSEDPAMHNLVLSVAASIRTVECFKEQLKTVTEAVASSASGPTWGAASLAYLDDFMGRRDPNLPENPGDGFGPEVMDKVYAALRDEMVPWLLDPFPV